MKVIKLFFLFTMLLILFSSKNNEEAVNLTGHWKGFLWQTQGGVAKKYGFEMWITQNDNKISGTTYIYLLDKRQNFAKMNFWGNLASRKVNFNEQKILNQKLSMGEWCIKNGSLFYEKKNHKKILSGTWFGCRTKHTQEDHIYLEKTK